MILVIDNYDSFVHTVANYLRELGATPDVVRNDARAAARDARGHRDFARALHAERGRGLDAACRGLFRPRADPRHLPWPSMHRASVRRPGHARAARPMHGEASLVRHEASGILEGLPNPLTVGRYHSLIVELDAAIEPARGGRLVERRRDHGSATSPASDVRRAISSRIDPHRPWPPDASQFSRPHRTPMMRVWQDGQLLAPEDAHVSIADRGLLLGDGVFETMAVCHGRVFDLDAHLARLASGLGVLGFAQAVDSRQAARRHRALSCLGSSVRGRSCASP